MSTRIAQIKAGTKRLGDVLGGYRITGFGQAWVVDDEDNCAFGAAPGERVRVCYAYGEPAQVEAALAAEAPPAPRDWREEVAERMQARRVAELESTIRTADNVLKNADCSSMHDEWRTKRAAAAAELETVRAPA